MKFIVIERNNKLIEIKEIKNDREAFIGKKFKYDKKYDIVIVGLIRKNKKEYYVTYKFLK